jgi:ketosteroid isomerase-like protein
VAEVFVVLTKTETGNLKIDKPKTKGEERMTRLKGDWELKLIRFGAVLVCLAFAQTVIAASKDEIEVRTSILRAMENWSALEADANEAYYTTSDKAVFFDFTPMQYVGWKTYRSEIEKVQDSIKEFKITLNDDLHVRVAGKFAYAHATWKMSFVFKDGTRRHLEGRLTEVLEKQKGQWKIVHEHASVPAPT